MHADPTGREPTDPSGPERVADWRTGRFGYSTPQAQAQRICLFFEAGAEEAAFGLFRKVACRGTYGEGLGGREALDGEDSQDAEVSTRGSAYHTPRQ